MFLPLPSVQGNLVFSEDGDVTLIENKKLVSVIRELLSTKEENVEKALLYRTVATGRDVIEKEHTAQEAGYGRDALAKVGNGESHVGGGERGVKKRLCRVFTPFLSSSGHV